MDDGESHYSLDPTSRHSSRKSSHRPACLRPSVSSMIPAYATSNIKRPVLLHRDYASIHQFMSQWKFYCYRVNTSGMSNRKKKEALNVCTCLADSVVHSLITFELPHLHIFKTPPTDTTPAVQYDLEDLTPDIVLQWLNTKLRQMIGRADMIPIIESMEKEIFGSSKYLFSYQPGKGTLREQLEDHSMLIYMLYEKYGAEDAISDITKVNHWIRLLRPWPMIKQAMLWMAQPNYNFQKTAYHLLTDILTHYRDFIDETIHVITTYLAPTIGICPSILSDLDAFPLTSDEIILLGPTGSTLLNAAFDDNNHDEDHLLKRKGVSITTSPTSSTASATTKKRKSQRSLLITGRATEYVDGNESATGIMICSNCGATGCFSSRCSNPCKFCNKVGCNSWTCSRRPVGYGDQSEQHPLPNSARTGRRSSHKETE
jgi:hypothetical protein